LLVLLVRANEPAPASTTTPTAKENAPSRLYRQATHLFEVLAEPKHGFPADRQALLAQYEAAMRKDAEILLREEIHLYTLEQQRDSIKGDFHWFFNSDLRQKAREIQSEVNAHRRIVEKVYDDIDEIWLKVKPLYGVYSRLFLREITGIVPWLLDTIVNFVTSFTIVSIIELLIFGPLAVFILTFWAAFGVTLIPIVLYTITLFWIIRLPFIIIQYDPTLFQFMSIYFPVVGLFLYLTSHYTGIWGPESSRRR